MFGPPDGLHFTNASARPIYHSDTQDDLLHDANISKYVAFRRLHMREAGGHKYDRDRYNRSCVRCRAEAGGYPSLNMSGEECGYACPSGPRGEACGGCLHLHPLPCSSDRDCAHVRRLTALGLCQGAAAPGNMCVERGGRKACATPAWEPLCVGPEGCGSSRIVALY